MEKEKKGIKCSYALLVVILFATVCFLTDYIIIERKTRVNNCPKCENTCTKCDVKEENSVVEESNEQINIRVIDPFDGLSCIEKSEEVCLIRNDSDKIAIKYDKTNDRHIFVVNGKDVDLNYSADFGEITYLPDNYIFINYNLRSYAIIDSNANVIVNFNDYDESNYMVDNVSYQDNKFIIKKTSNTQGAADACDLGFPEDNVMNIYYYYKYSGAGEVGSLLEKKEVTLRQYIKAEKGVNSCSEYLNR